MGFTISDLSLDEANIILAGLGELPFKASSGLVRKIQEQVIPQIQAEEAAGTLEEAAAE